MIAQEAILGGYHAPNIGYVRRLFLLDRANCVSVLDPSRNPAAGATPGLLPVGGLAVALGATLYRMDFPPKSCTMSFGYAGMITTVTIEYDLPGTNVALSNFFATGKNRQYVVLVEDNNGRCYVLGNEERGLRVGLTQAVAGVANSRFTLTARLNVPPFQLVAPNGLVLAEVLPDSDFGIGFSLDFNA
ncbi:hypothetical protein GCM10007390_17260 [Persicitalea jodogahamensis]|uniref:Uncharacterized protein n=2 Tax=Persicitalea jodogahamensis TaxID=402147 RepID=A0A8J3G9J0_9BACT|nr:hypothetical protein GCM10007390_17260 [Persicitalea jodogahamensis]